jgi:MFS family permease
MGSAPRGARCPGALKSLLGDRNYVVYALGNTVSSLGTWAQRIGIGWLSWDLTHDATWVGIISFAQLLPLIVLGPVFGALLDRHDHRRYAVTVNAVLAILAALLYALTAAHHMNIFVLLSVAVLAGVANSAYQSARMAIVNDVVGLDKLPAAIAANSILFNLSRAVGPAIAGAIILHSGTEAVFAVNALSYAGIIASLLLVELRVRRTQLATGRSLLAESLEGLRYLRSHRELQLLMLLSGVTSTLGRAIMELLPAFADGIYKRGSLGLANLTTAAGVGAIAGALLLSRYGAGDGLQRMTRLSTLLVGVTVAAFGLCADFRFALGVVGALGFVTVLSGVGQQVLLQARVHDGYRGRVLGLWTAVNVAGPGLGSAATGYGSRLLGLKGATLVAGGLCLLLVFWLQLSHRRQDPGPPGS